MGSAVVITADFPSPSEQPPVRKRRRLDPKPHFKPDTTRQLDAISGCPTAFVPEGHLAWKVKAVLEKLDFSSLEAGYSSLGRQGYRPSHVVAVLVYGSLVGLHHSTKLARALETDAALRLLSGGHSIAEGTLRRRRREWRAFFEDAIAQTVKIADEEGLLHLEELATDSMRLRAHASTSAVRTVKRSRERQKELAAVDVSSLPEDERAKHEAKVKKHEEALRECERRGSASVVVTNELASLMKFPSGAGLPGHRVTVTAAGVKERLVVGFLVDGDPTDAGKLEAALTQARRVLCAAGVAPDAKCQVAADAGYWDEPTLRFCAENRDLYDVLINEKPTVLPHKHFTREQFQILDDESAICPAGRRMMGPYPHHGGRILWLGVGCDECPLKEKCTSGKARSLTANLELERARKSMQDRMQQDGARGRYNQRVATIEPVFSSIEDNQGYRRASSRKVSSVVAEVLLKLLAHNISRLAAAGISCVLILELQVSTSGVTVTGIALKTLFRPTL
jgi:transposase